MLNNPFDTLRRDYMLLTYFLFVILAYMFVGLYSAVNDPLMFRQATVLTVGGTLGMFLALMIARPTLTLQFDDVLCYAMIPVLLRSIAFVVAMLAGEPVPLQFVIITIVSLAVAAYIAFKGWFLKADFTAKDALIALGIPLIVRLLVAPVIVEASAAADTLASSNSEPTTSTESSNTLLQFINTICLVAIVGFSEEVFRATLIYGFTLVIEKSLVGKVLSDVMGKYLDDFIAYFVVNSIWIAYHAIQRGFYLHPVYIVWLFITGVVLTRLVKAGNLGAAMWAHFFVDTIFF